MTLELPWPPSTNHAYRNTSRGRAKTSAAKAYAEDVGYRCHTSPAARDFRTALTPASRFAVRITAHPPDRRRRDLANLEKIAIDAIFDWLGHDDSAIDDLHITRAEPRKPGALIVTITEAQL